MMNIEGMRKAREKASVAFMQFCNQKARYDTAVFCFFEGEDSKYYCSRMCLYAGKNIEDLCCIPCDGKASVKRVHEMISARKEYNKVKKAFFIDRDYLPSSVLPNDMYETTCYSIENFYTSKSAFGRILTIAFGINQCEPDFDKCMNDYVTLQKEFEEGVTYLNAWAKCQRLLEEERGEQRLVNLQNVCIGRFFSISFDGVILNEPIDERKVKSLFPEAYSVPSSLMAKTLEEMNNCDKQQMFRGHYEWEFTRLVLMDLRTKNKGGKYFSIKRKRVYFDPNNDPLLLFSSMADTPESLQTFLKKYA